MTWLDYFIITAIAISSVIGLIRGFTKEAISLVIWGLAIFLGMRFSPMLSYVFAKYIASSQLRLALSFIILMLSTLIIGAITNYLLTEIINKTGLGGTNRSIGFVFGLLRGLLIAAVVLLIAQFSPLPKSADWKNSILVPQLLPVTGWIKTRVVHKYDQYFDNKPTKRS